MRETTGLGKSYILAAIDSRETDYPELRLTLFGPVAEADSIMRVRHLVGSFANG